ncbi:hypothetical protein Cabys_3948 [Caldithrix abyssi DSM 13497]|uniref:Uncharacterized protein n=1 Tax=Caldithrix abyssi DSM 13497 TaxID=880073 RepID=A0A1J1CD92_CALAY|nr:hypothetical protein Cabys_3948 [Caldithrix abyssi DSM 13497]
MDKIQLNLLHAITFSFLKPIFKIFSPFLQDKEPGRRSPPSFH